MKYLSHCRAKSQMKRRLIKKKNQKNSRIENSRIASTMIVLAYAKRNIRSTIVFIWSRTFARLNENRTKKLWRKSKKFSKRIHEWKIAIKYARKNVKRRLEKIIENEDDSNDESSKKKFFDDEVTLNVLFAETFAKRQVSYKLINCWTLDSEIDIHVCNDSDRF
jgi:hypothetical protein